MANKSKKAKAGWRLYSGLVVVCAIVIGVAILSVTASKIKPLDTKAQSVQIQAPAISGKGPAFLVFSSEGLRLMSLDGSSELNITWPDDISRLGTPLSQIRGVDLETGQSVWLDSGFARASSTVWRSPDGRRNAYLAPDRRDGSGAVEVRQGNESTLLVLRQKSGRKIIDEQLLGWLDKDTMALVAVATSTRSILTLDLNGTLTPIASLPDDAWLVKVADGAVYYARATPGEGIESPQQSPSSIWRASPGKAEKIVEDTAHVIQNFVASSSTVYYSLEDNSIKASENGSIRDLGQGRVLMSVPNQGVIGSKSGQLFLIKPDGQNVPLNLDAKDSLFYLPQASLDETP